MWKQDLAKLKPQLGEDPTPAKPPPTPKPSEETRSPRLIEDEDALFLRSMGRTAAPPPSPAAPAAQPPPPPPTAEAPVDFAQAMSSLKGLKPMAPELPSPTPAKPIPALAVPQPAAPHRPLPPTAPLPPAPQPPMLAAADARPKAPTLIQLAAGMAIDVDGVLDLRNHTLSDARERLKERLEDAMCMGWRSVHVILGASEALKQGFLAFLTTPPARAVQRYAQAPIPMGGPQAWILYLGGGPV